MLCEWPVIFFTASSLKIEDVGGRAGDGGRWWDGGKRFTFLNPLFTVIVAEVRWIQAPANWEKNLNVNLWISAATTNGR